MADESLGSASVEIVANLGALAPALDRARQIVATSMSDIQQTVETASNAIFTALESYGVLKLAQWGSELFDVGRSAVETGARMQETATAVGLTAEQYQVFSFAARQAGVDQEKFSQAMIFFSRNLGLISQGSTTPATKAFADLGATIKTNADGTVNYGATLTEFLTKLGRVSDSTRATADAMEAFGRSGGRMVLVAKEIADDGFDNISQKARAMGLVLSNETVAQSKELEDQFKTLSTVVENDVIRGMVALAPEIQQVIDKVITLSDTVSRFISLAPNLDSLTKEQIALYESGLAPALEEATAKLQDLQTQQQRYSQQGIAPPRGLTDDLQKQLDLVQELGSKMTAAQQAMQRILHPDTGAGLGSKPVTTGTDDGTDAAQEKLQQQFDKTTESLASQTAGYVRLADAMGLGVNAMREAETANAIQNELDKFSGRLTAQQVQQIYNEMTARQEEKFALDDEKKALDEATQSQQKQNEEVETFLKSIEDAHTPVEKFNEDLDKLNVLLASGDISWEEYSDDVSRAYDQIFNVDKQSQKTADTMADEVSSAVARGASSFLNLASSSQKGVSTMQQLGKAGEGLAQDLLKVIEQLFVLNPLINALKSALGSNAAPLPTGWGGGGDGAGSGGSAAAEAAQPAETGADQTAQSGGYGSDSSGASIPGIGSIFSGAEKYLTNVFNDPQGILHGLFGSNADTIDNFFANSLSGAESFAGAAASGIGNAASGVGSFFETLFGFAKGGSFDVGGGGGVDSQLVAFKATPGEHVSVGQDKGPSAAAQQPMNVFISNNHPGAQVSAEPHPNGRDMIVQIDEAVANQVRQGGATWRAMRDSAGLSRVPIQR
ncbi:MAG: hypothetical protein WBQ86_12675 [Candidatus Binatus sp.]